MQRPVMDPMLLNDPVPAPRVRASRFRWLGRMLLRIGKVLLSNPFGRRPRVKIEDGKPLARFIRGTIYRLALVPVVIVGFSVAIVLAATHPRRTLDSTDPLTYGVYYDPIGLVAEDGVRLDAWLVPAVDARRVLEQREAVFTRKLPAVVLVHDFAGSRQELLPLIRPLHDRGIVVLALDLRGRSTLSGEPQTFGLNEAMDIKAAVDLLRRRPFVDNSRIAVLGTGTGANAAILAATRDPSLAALVLDDPADGFDDAFARRVGRGHGWLPPMRPIFRWTFQVMYRVDTEDLKLAKHAELLESSKVLRTNGRELLEPRTIRQIEQFLSHQLGLEATADAN